MTEPGDPMKENHFSCLDPGFCSFGHDPNLRTTGEGWNVDKELCLSPQPFLHYDQPKQHCPYWGPGLWIHLHPIITQEQTSASWPGGQDPQLPEELEEKIQTLNQALELRNKENVQDRTPMLLMEPDCTTPTLTSSGLATPKTLSRTRDMQILKSSRCLQAVISWWENKLVT